MSNEPFQALLADEQKFVYHYLREGCAEDKLYLVERKCRLKAGMGKQFLGRKRVAAEIKRRRELVEWEEAKQIARDKAKVAAEEDARQSITQDLLDEALRGVVKLKPEDHAAAILKGVELGLVYIGAIRNGNMVRVVVEDPTKKDPALENPTNAFYRSIFHPDAPAGERAAPLEAAPLFPPGQERPHAPPPPPTLPHEPPAQPQKNVQKPAEAAASGAPTKKKKGPLEVEIS